MRNLSRVALLLVLGAVSAAGQSDGNSIPRGLAMAILRFQGVSSLSYYGPANGTPVLSTDVPATMAAVMPKLSGVTVLGSVNWGQYADVFGTAQGTVEQVKAAFSADFTKRGYRAVDENTRMMQYGGFRDDGPARAQGFCADADGFSIDALPVDAGTSAFRLRYRRADQNCRSTNIIRMSMPMEQPEYPTLINPANASRVISMGGCREMNGPGSGTSVELQTTMTPTDLIKHYDKQIASAGWKPANVPSQATSMWVKTDSAGNETLLTLTATAPRGNPTCRSVQMMVSHPPARIK